MPFIPPDVWAHKADVLDAHCDERRPRPGRIRSAVNVGLAFTDESCRQQFGALADDVRPGVLAGSDEQMVDNVGRYVDAGADQVNLAMRAPFDRRPRTVRAA